MPVDIFEIIFRYAVRRRNGGLHCRGFEPANHSARMIDSSRISLVCRR